MMFVRRIEHLSTSVNFAPKSHATKDVSAVEDETSGRLNYSLWPTNPENVKKNYIQYLLNFSS